MSAGAGVLVVVSVVGAILLIVTLVGVSRNGEVVPINPNITGFFCPEIEDLGAANQLVTRNCSQQAEFGICEATALSCRERLIIGVEGDDRSVLCTDVSCSAAGLDCACGLSVPTTCERLIQGQNLTIPCQLTAPSGLECNLFDSTTALTQVITDKCEETAVVNGVCVESGLFCLPEVFVSGSSAADELSVPREDLGCNSDCEPNQPCQCFATGAVCRALVTPLVGLSFDAQFACTQE